MERKKITIFDIFITAVAVFLVLILIKSNLSVSLDKNEASVIVIKKYGETIKQIDLPTSDKIYTYNVSDEEDFIICYDNEGVWIKSSNCRDKLCIKQGKLTNSAGALICLPNGYSVSLKSNENEVDGVVK